jgi:hypothetical protein
MPCHFVPSKLSVVSPLLNSLVTSLSAASRIMGGRTTHPRLSHRCIITTRQSPWQFIQLQQHPPPPAALKEHSQNLKADAACNNLTTSIDGSLPRNGRTRFRRTLRGGMRLTWIEYHVSYVTVLKHTSNKQNTF